jgi:adenosylcobinamide-GDP ribazoletransferase
MPVVIFENLCFQVIVLSPMAGSLNNRQPCYRHFLHSKTPMTDNPPSEPSRFQRMRPFAELLHAMRFLTRLPLPFAKTVDLPPLSQSMRLFPVAGGLIGAIIGLLFWMGLSLGLTSLLAATLAVGIGLLMTGALHEDGLADTADGFGGGKTREQRLLIMRDSRIGTYGTLALVIAVGLRIMALEGLTGLDVIQIIAVLAGCAAFSRALMVDLLWATRPARDDGLSHYAGTPGRNGAAFAVLTGAIMVIAAGFLVVPYSGFLALAVALGVTAYMRQLTTRLIGGQTGDVCGAVQVLSEIAMLCVFVATKG